MVYGTDPSTGTPAIVRSGLSRGAAVALVKRLRAEGWQVRGVREAFGLRDGVVDLAAFTVIGGMALPVVGAIPAMLVARRWRAGSIRPFLHRTLPPLSVDLPPKQHRPRGGRRWSGGLLLLLAAMALGWWPPAAAIPAVLLVALIAWSWQGVPPEPAEVARRGGSSPRWPSCARPSTPAGSASTILLALTGEAELLEGEWSEGRVDAERVLVRVDDSARSVRESAPRAELQSATLEALRRTRERTTVRFGRRAPRCALHAGSGCVA